MLHELTGITLIAAATLGRVGVQRECVANRESLINQATRLTPSSPNLCNSAFLMRFSSLAAAQRIGCSLELTALRA